MKTKQAVAQYLARCIRDSGKTQAQIAEKAGFPTPNTLSMMCTGRMQIPLKRVPELAKATGSDPRELLSYCLEAYAPELYSLIANLHPSMLVTADELRLVRTLRRSGTASS
jgi:transcriptional regulator with XRE-family HTH domain